ncbi:MAG: retropepsin-like domain-containing protein [Chromatiaceae bacterium]|nr:retropepsin-like domain-containing protein [Chromatiaceae bacterium]
MKLVLRESLLFSSLTLAYRGARLEIDDILVDTGSSTTLLSIDAVAPLGIHPEPTDIIRRIRGVGGVEYVFSRQVDAIALHGYETASLEAEFGDLNFGLKMNGILGLDVLLRARAVLDLGNLAIKFSV